MFILLQVYQDEPSKALACSSDFDTLRKIYWEEVFHRAASIKEFYARVYSVQLSHKSALYEAQSCYQLLVAPEVQQCARY